MARKAMTLGELKRLISRREALKEKIDGLRAKEAELKSKLEEIDEAILVGLGDFDQVAVGGRTYYPLHKSVYRPADWESLFRVAAENDLPHIFYRRLNQSATAEALELVPKLRSYISEDRYTVLGSRKR